jgi:hypothetical protein
MLNYAYNANLLAREGNTEDTGIRKPPDASLSDLYSDPKLDLSFSGWGIA